MTAIPLADKYPVATVAVHVQEFEDVIAAAHVHSVVGGRVHRHTALLDSFEMQPAAADLDAHRVTGRRYRHLGEVNQGDLARIRPILDSVGIGRSAFRELNAGAGRMGCRDAVGPAAKPDRVPGHGRIGALLKSGERSIDGAGVRVTARRRNVIFRSKRAPRDEESQRRQPTREEVRWPSQSERTCCGYHRCLPW